MCHLYRSSPIHGSPDDEHSRHFSKHIQKTLATCLFVHNCTCTVCETLFTFSRIFLSSLSTSLSLSHSRWKSSLKKKSNAKHCAFKKAFFSVKSEGFANVFIRGYLCSPVQRGCMCRVHIKALHFPISTTGISSPFFLRSFSKTLAHTTSQLDDDLRVSPLGSAFYDYHNSF